LGVCAGLEVGAAELAGDHRHCAAVVVGPDGAVLHQVGGGEDGSEPVVGVDELVVRVVAARDVELAALEPEDRDVVRGVVDLQADELGLVLRQGGEGPP
jgi:hypothetical protein